MAAPKYSTRKRINPNRPASKPAYAPGLSSNAHASKLAQAKTYIDINELSLISGYSVSSLRRALQDDKLESTSRGKNFKVLFTHEQVERFLNGRSENE